MFDHLFKSLSDLHNRTALLEACSWDEERLEEVMSIFLNSISKIQNSSFEYYNINSLKDYLSSILSKDLTEREIIILLDLFSQTSDAVINEIKEESYEN